ncbi:MAG: SDR family oxidoreductase [Chloroflexi bacterium]|nr:SDR family oxidoreductase [Chloroflexota bacterium]MCL5274554.1 SDR family oxidoreductase [Chloroflexota bacterium]
MIDPQLKDKVVLITGANNPSGIGAAAARAFAAQGARLFLHTYHRSYAAPAAPQEPGEAMYLSLQNAGDAVVRELRAAGARVEDIEADLQDVRNLPLLFDRAESAYGRVDVLINNAANTEQDTFIPLSQLSEDSRAVDGFSVTTISAELHDRHFAVISRAPALLMAEFARRKIERGERWGRIINISTDAAATFPTEVSYGASKHALESYSRSAAAELGPYGITVNIAALGPIQTGWISSALEQDIAAKTPLRRVGRPDDVADVLVFLASEQARWITGQLIYIGGGWRMPM